VINRVKGVYLIERIGEDFGPKYYIGQAKNIFERLNEHFTNPVQNVDKDIEKYGIDKFVIRVLERVSTAELDERERYHIAKYTELHGESQMYNKQTGGKSGHEPMNTELLREERVVRKQVRKVFDGEISISVYLVAERFKLTVKEVIEIRKSMLKKNGLVYDNSQGEVVCVKTGKVPLGWHGGTFTRKMISKYSKLKGSIDADELAGELGCTVRDLKRFEEVNDGTYKCAEEVCNTSSPKSVLASGTIAHGMECTQHLQNLRNG